MSDGYLMVVCGKVPENIPDRLLEDLQRRAAMGTLVVECGPPRRQPYMDDGQWHQRVHQVEMERACGVIIEIRRGEGDLIVGKVKPAGPHKAFIEEAMGRETPGLTFGLRGFRNIDGTLARVVTYDLIDIPGE